MNNSIDKLYKTPNDEYLFIVKLALQRYSLETDDFYKLNNWTQIFKHPEIVRTAYVALDLWNTEKFVGLEKDKHIEARRILITLLNA